MVDPDLVASKLSDLADHLERVRIRRKATAEGLAGDRDALDLVAFNLMLAVQTCADIASHLIADEGWAAVASLGVAFERLRDQGVIHVAATAGLTDLETFSREVAHWIQSRRS
jgi:uncharacterized protein YutE (UPF0331/DUF86 family)